MIAREPDISPTVLIRRDFLNLAVGSVGPDPQVCYRLSHLGNAARAIFFQRCVEVIHAHPRVQRTRE